MTALLLLVVAAADRLPPVDEGAKDASFAAFRTKLKAIVLVKDLSALVKHVDPKVRTSFGEGGGIADFKKTWSTKPLWNELGQVLALGSTKEGPGYWAPYIFGKWPNDLDPFENVVAIGSAVPLYDKPGGKMIEKLDYAILQRKGPPLSQTWSKVVSPSKRTGYVHNWEVRSQVDYRAYFERKGNTWKMSVFVAGD